MADEREKEKHSGCGGYLTKALCYIKKEERNELYQHGQLLWEIKHL